MIDSLLFIRNFFFNEDNCPEGNLCRCSDFFDFKILENQGGFWHFNLTLHESLKKVTKYMVCASKQGRLFTICEYFLKTISETPACPFCNQTLSVPQNMPSSVQSCQHRPPNTKLFIPWFVNVVSTLRWGVSCNLLAAIAVKFSIEAVITFGS